MNKALTADLIAREMLKSISTMNRLDSIIANMPRETPIQGPPTLLEMIVGIIEDGVSGYEYEMDAEEIAAKIIAVLRQ